MNTQRNELAVHPGKTPGRGWFVIAALLLAAYIANVALRMIHIKLGISLWWVSDVGEFLLVLFSMVFFVAGVLTVEEHAPDQS